MVSVIQKSNEWSLSVQKREFYNSSDNEKLSLSDSETSSRKSLLKPSKLDVRRASKGFHNIIFTKKSPNKKQSQAKGDYRETANYILLGKPQLNHFEKPDCDADKDQSRRGFCRRVRSFTSRLILRRKSNEERNNIQRCQSWPSYNSSNTAFAKHLRSLAKDNEILPRLEEVLQDKKASNGYYEFLKKEYAEENILFVSEVEKYKKLKSEKNRKSKANEIYTNYILQDSPKEINVSHKTRADVSDGLIDLETSLFDTAQRYIMFLLESDSFKRFISVHLNC